MCRIFKSIEEVVFVRFLITGSLIALVAFSMVSLVHSDAGVGLDITVHPGEPVNFQPISEGENRALIKVKAIDYPSESMGDSILRLRLTHLKGRGLINTGFPHMEGKLVFAGELPMRDNEAAIEYSFPIRGNYLLEAELLKAPSMMQIARGDLVVHAREPFFEIRNSIILFSFVFVFGIYLGRIYGAASRGVAE